MSPKQQKQSEALRHNTERREGANIGANKQER